MSFPLPEPTPLSQPYWDALKHGRLTFQRCIGAPGFGQSADACSEHDLIVESLKSRDLVLG